MTATESSPTSCHPPGHQPLDTTSLAVSWLPSHAWLWTCLEPSRVSSLSPSGHPPRSSLCLLYLPPLSPFPLIRLSLPPTSLFPPWPGCVSISQIPLNLPTSVFPGVVGEGNLPLYSLMDDIKGHRKFGSRAGRRISHMYTMSQERPVRPDRAGTSSGKGKNEKDWAPRSQGTDSPWQVCLGVVDTLASAVGEHVLP